VFYRTAAFISLCLFSVLSRCYATSDSVFHVAVTGSDSADGSAVHPFATPARAADAVRNWQKSAHNGGKASVVVHAGEYSLSTSLNLSPEPGVPQRPVQWRSAPGAKVSLIGGKSIPASAFHRVTDPQVLSRLAAVARESVVTADISFAGSIAAFPVQYHGAPPGPELYFNGVRMDLAHWPNKGWATIDKILDSGSLPREGDMSNRPGKFRYSGDRPGNWREEEGIWLQGYWCFDWYDEVIQVASINRDAHSITLARPHLYSLRQGNPSPRRYRALNLLEELDQPGEFYIDRKARRLYLWPPANVSTASITLATLEAPLVVANQAINLTFSGFHLRAGLASAIDFTECSHSTIENCEAEGMRLTGINVKGGTSDRVANCSVHDTGTGGITVEGGDRARLIPGRHVVENCHIYRFSIHQQTAAYGLTFGGVGCKASHCEIHDAPHQAIFVGGNDHVFEYSEIYRVCTETDDCGALYKGRNPSCRGNRIQYNYWHDIGSPMGHGNAAIYFDDGDGGDYVIGNLFWRCGDPGRGSFGTVFSHGGHDIVARNNLFVDCKRAFGSAPWDDKRWRSALDGGEDCFFSRKLLQEVDITKPPYTSHYPELKGFMHPAPGSRNSYADDNILINCQNAHGGNWQFSAESNVQREGDPGFADMAKGDFRMPDSAFEALLPGFRPLPIGKMGRIRHP
jgi:Right handed beta helix region